MIGIVWEINISQHVLDKTMFPSFITKLFFLLMSNAIRYLTFSLKDIYLSNSAFLSPDLKDNVHK